MTPDPNQERSLFEAAVSALAENGGHGVVPVAGDSMRPTLEPGAAVEVEFGPTRLRRGDLLLFRQVDYLVVHRLLGRGRRQGAQPTLRTRGDGVPALDPPVLRGSVLGRVVAVRRAERWRRLSGGRARAYALAVAAHDLFWAAAIATAGRAEKALAAAGVGVSLRDRAVRADRALLVAADRVLFVAFHPRCAPPDPSGAGSEAST